MNISLTLTIEENGRRRYSTSEGRQKVLKVGRRPGGTSGQTKYILTTVQNK